MIQHIQVFFFEVEDLEGLRFNPEKRPLMKKQEQWHAKIAKNTKKIKV